jgi:hypothetical protein
MLLAVLRVVGALSLLVLPGAWLAFGCPLAGVSRRARWALAIVLSPLVVVAEFYPLRWIGAPFELTAVLLPILNLPALWLVARRMRGAALPSARAALVWGTMLLLPATFLATWLHDPQVRANRGHAWTHADIVYLLANGELRPEEPQLAGVRLAYPWLGHVHQGTVSWLLDIAPNDSFLLTNIVWLLAVLVLVAEVVGRLGGGRLAQAGVAVWLSFAVNFVGLVARRVIPRPLLARYPMWGDARYTPWLRKFGVFEQTMLGIGLFAALLFVLARAGDEESDGSSWLVVAFALLVSAAILYPVLYPASAALAAARIVILVARRWQGRAVPWRTVVGIGVALVASGVAGLAYVAYVSADHAAGATLGPATPYAMRVKGATLVIVLAPLLAGAVLVARPLWRRHAELVALLAMGALGSMLLHAGLDVYFYANEYKFVFTAAVCLTPFPLLALERSRGVLGRAAPALAVALAMLLPVPALMMIRDPDIAPGAPTIDVDAFPLALARGEPLADVASAIRSGSPTDAVLVSEDEPFDLVAVTARPVYVAAASAEVMHGIGLRTDYLLKQSRGYASSLIDQRRAAVRVLYEASDTTMRERILAHISRELRRPLVLLVRRGSDAPLDRWLARRAGARPVFTSDAYSAWRVDTAAAAHVADHTARR